MDLASTFHAVSTFFKDNKDLLTIAIAAVGGTLALIRYWKDQSWQKKQFAYDYAQKVFGEAKTMTALRMMDWRNGSIPKEIAAEYELAEADRKWTTDEVARALRVHDDPPTEEQGRFSPKEYVIRELFDACLAHFERLGHFMKAGVISATDFPTTLAYYPEIMVEKRLDKLRGPLRAYMKRYKFDYACFLFDEIERYARTAGPPHEDPGMGVDDGTEASEALAAR